MVTTVAAPVTYGSIRWENGNWVVTAVPFVSMRIKRLFPRVWRAATSDMWIRDTPEVARDLEWLLERHPLDVDSETLDRLHDRANHHRDIEQTRARIIAGDQKFDLKEPARQARDYQVQAADLCLATGRLLLADDVGLGKTFSSLLLYGGEVHNIFQVLAPDSLGTRQEFTREWGVEMSGGHIRVSQPRALGTYLRDEGLMLRRTRTDVHRELPDPIRIVHEVETDGDALAKVKGDVRALAELIRSSADKTERWRAAGEIDWKLRQATGIDKAVYVAEFVRLLLESEAKVVLYGWHRAVYEIWLQQLAEFKPVLFTGSESTKQKDAAKDAFTDGDARVLIMSLRSGAGLDGLQACSSVLVFGELDWSPAMHDQCIGRLARDGQEATVAAYFLVSDKGSDPVIAERLELKRQQAEPIRNPDQDVVAPITDTSGRIQALVDSILEPKDLPE